MQQYIKDLKSETVESMIYKQFILEGRAVRKFHIGRKIIKTHGKTKHKKHIVKSETINETWRSRGGRERWRDDRISPVI